MSDNKKKHVTGVLGIQWGPAQVQAAFTEWMREHIWGKQK